MKHMVQIQVTPQAGRDVDTRPGGPGPIISRVVERFKPEVVYASPARRVLFMVCDLTPTDMAELVSAALQFSGQYPEFIPVVPASELGAIAAKALPAARKLVDG